MVYFIQSSEGSIKIGYSQNIQKRLKSLQTNHSSSLQLLGIIKGDKQKEKEIHNLFKNSRIKGEWFFPSYQVLKFIKENTTLDLVDSTDKIDHNNRYTTEQIVIKMGKDIETLRLQKNITRVNLSKESGLSINAIRHLESGKAATIKTLVAVMIILGKMDWLLNVAPIISINPLHMGTNGKPRRRASRSK